MNPDALFEAIKADDLPTVERILAEQPELELARDADGLTPVIVARYWFKSAALDRLLARRGDDLDVFEAAVVGRADLVERWLDAEPSLVRAWSPDGFTALHLPAFFGGDNVALLLIERGADVNAVARNEMRVAPLHSAAAGPHPGICRMLVEHGADVNAAQRGGYTPLIEAAQNGDVALVELFLEAGADPAARLDDGRIAADVAMQAGHTALADRLQALA